MIDDDDDIKDLLDQLDAAEDDAQDAGAAAEVTPDDQPSVISNSSDIPVGLAEPPGPLPSAPTQVIRVGQQEEEAKQTAISVPESPIEIKKFIANYYAAHSEVIADCRSDRAETQGVISMLQADIDSIKTSSGPQAVPRIYIEALVKALEVKANINDTKVKMTDSGAKLVAALRSQIVNINNQQTGVDGALENILVRPLDAGTDDF